MCPQQFVMLFNSMQVMPLMLRNVHHFDAHFAWPIYGDSEHTNIVIDWQYLFQPSCEKNEFSWWCVRNQFSQKVSLFGDCIISSVIVLFWPLSPCLRIVSSVNESHLCEVFTCFGQKVVRKVLFNLCKLYMQPVWRIPFKAGHQVHKLWLPVPAHFIDLSCQRSSFRTIIVHLQFHPEIRRRLLTWQVGHGGIVLGEGEDCAGGGGGCNYCMWSVQRACSG